MRTRALTIVVVVLLGASLARAHAAPAATFHACGVFAVAGVGFPLTCPSLPGAIAQATANPGADTISLDGGDYCPIVLTGDVGDINFVGGGFGTLPSAALPSYTTGPEAEAAKFTSHVTGCAADTGYLVKIDNVPNTISFVDVSFEDETASGVGRGIAMNSTPGASAVGSLVLRDVIVKNNSIGVTFSGFSPSRFTMTGSTVTGNGTGIALGGVEVASITNTTVADNTNIGLDTGNNYSIQLGNDTITRNFIGVNARCCGNRVDIVNTIITANTASDCSGPNNFSGGHNLIGTFCGAVGSGDQVSTGLTLPSLNLNGGPTTTILPPQAAIDTGANGSCQTSDQREFLRTDGACDIGAVEFNATPPANTPPSPTPTTLTFGPLTITFASVTGAGTTTVTTSETGPAIPAGFELQGSYYEVTTSAVFTTARLCISDPDITASSRLLHYPGPTDVTQLPVAPPQICSGPLTSFSPFAAVRPVPDTTAPALAVTHVANGTNGWNVSGPVTVTIAASDGGSGLAGAPTCTDAANGTAPAPVTVTGSAPAFSASVTGDGLHQISCQVGDLVGNPSAVVADTVKLDTVAPIVTFSGNAGSYTVGQTVTITCAAADPAPGSGLTTSTCANVSRPAADFPLGSNVLAADATDGAGNVGHGTATFTVAAAPAQVTVGSLCLLTKQYVQTSTRYRALAERQRLAVDALADAICRNLAAIGPRLTPPQKAAFVAIYKVEVLGLVLSGWLTKPQGTTLVGLANQL